MEIEVEINGNVILQREGRLLSTRSQVPRGILQAIHFSLIRLVQPNHKYRHPFIHIIYTYESQSATHTNTHKDKEVKAHLKHL